MQHRGRQGPFTSTGEIEGYVSKNVKHIEGDRKAG